MKGETTKDVAMTDLCHASPDISGLANAILATDDSAYFYFSGLTAVSNASYKVVFAGGTSGFGSSANTLTASESAPVTFSVSRTIKAKTKGLKVIGKVVPDFGKKKLKILQVVGKKKTKKYARVKTNKAGRFTFRAPNKRGFRFVVVVPADAMYAATYAEYHVI